MGYDYGLLMDELMYFYTGGSYWEFEQQQQHVKPTK